MTNTNTAERTARITTNQTKSFCDFPSRDAKGRTIGAHIYRFDAEHVVSDDGLRNHYIFPAGRYFGFKPQATRNGASYGAAQSTQLFNTVEEREAAIADYLKNAMKRAAAK
jgi:hypothetical protein